MSVTSRLLAALSRRMRRRAPVPASDDGARGVRSEPPAPITAPARPVEPDLELEQLAAEARYHGDRFDLYRARVISGSTAPTSAARLRRLERAARAAAERLAHARRRSPDR